MVLLVALALVLMMIWQKWEIHTGANVEPGKVAGTTKKGSAQNNKGTQKTVKKAEGVPVVPTVHQGTQSQGTKPSTSASVSLPISLSTGIILFFPDTS